MKLLFDHSNHVDVFVLGKEKILVCSDCRIYFKCYGEFPCLEPPAPLVFSPEPSIEEEVDFEEEEEIDEPEEEAKPLSLKTEASSLGGELNLTAIERDSDLVGDNQVLDEDELVKPLNPLYTASLYSWDPNTRNI